MNVNADEQYRFVYALSSSPFERICQDNFECTEILCIYFAFDIVAVLLFDLENSNVCFVARNVHCTMEILLNLIRDNIVTKFYFPWSSFLGSRTRETTPAKSVEKLKEQ